MSNELMRTQLEESLGMTSLKARAREAESVMLLIDTSGSMGAMIGREGKTRIQALREIVAQIKVQGSVPMIAFGGPYDAQVRFVDNVPDPDGGTPLHIAIPMAKEYGATRIVVISDGVPDLRDESLNQAKLFGGRIDVVFVGDKGEEGEEFLARLAKMTGGTSGVGNLADTKKLTGQIIGLLEGEVEERAPIQGEGFTTVDEPEPADDDEETDEDDDEGDDDDDEDDE
jgi:hypothetical protein